MKTRVLLTVLLLSVLLGLGISCWHQKNTPTDSDKPFGSLFASKYTGHVAVEKLAKHLTSNEKEQKAIAEFIYNLENVFHINPHVLFQNSDYLTVSLTVTKNRKAIRRVELIFSNNEPRVNIFDDPEGENTVYWNGRVEYEIEFWDGKTYYESWFEGPSKYSNWSSGKGYGDDPNCWYKIINLRKFDWYQPLQP